MDISQRNKAGRDFPPTITFFTLPINRWARGKTFSMSRGSFVFSPTALRSLERDEDMLQRHEHKQQMASRCLSSYMLKREARSRLPLRSSTAQPAPICKDVVVQNALYTGDLEAMRHLFPRGSSANLIIEPQGGDMRWVARGEGKRQEFYWEFSGILTSHAVSSLTFQEMKTQYYKRLNSKCAF